MAGEKTELEIELLLPEAHGTADQCVQRLIDLIQARQGVDRAHIRETDGDQSDRICIHFDPRQLSLGDVRHYARQAGTDLGRRYGHLLVATRPMHARRARTLKGHVESIHGVLDAGVSADGRITVEIDQELTDADAIRQAIAGAGIEIDWEHAGPAASSACDHHHHGAILGENSELIFALICGGLLASGWLISLNASLPGWMSQGCLVAAYLFGGFYIVREAVEKTLQGRFEIDFLMIVAAAGAAILGHWAEGALLLFLFSLGHALEHYAMGRARKAIESLSDLAPETATVRRNDQLVEIPIEELVPGDLVIVRTNERIACDGLVVRGTSSVNQAPITGESLPVDKCPVDDPRLAAAHPERIAAEHRVFAGTINQSGSLEVRVTRLARETTLARIITLVNEAETRQSPTQQFTNRFERIFVPAVVGLVVLLMFAFLVVDESFADSFYRAMAVLVAASPCALAIATPSAVLSGVARAARSGVLFKGGGPLESLGHVTAMAFDKTGTLTAGQPQITDVVCCDGVTEIELLQNAIAVEQLSDHPLANAVVRDGRQRLGDQDIPAAVNLHSVTGRGIQADVEGTTVSIGQLQWYAEMENAPIPEELADAIDRLESQGRTTMLVRHGQRYLGAIGLMDTPRPSARSTIVQLRELGMQRMIMISGDNQQVASAVAGQVGIDEAWGNLLPDDKVQAIRRLRSAGDVAMVGDGVNDAPAMANASVGIAMGAAGSDVALETADVALMGDDLSRLPFAVGLSRQTSRVIRQNLLFSLGMVAVLVPATLWGLGIGPAVLFHEGSTLLVVVNALRLLVYENRSA